MKKKMFIRYYQKRADFEPGESLSYQYGQFQFCLSTSFEYKDKTINLGWVVVQELKNINFKKGIDVTDNYVFSFKNIEEVFPLFWKDWIVDRIVPILEDPTNPKYLQLNNWYRSKTPLQYTIQEL